MLTEITISMLDDVSHLLQCPQRLSIVKELQYVPIQGLFYGPYNRLFIPLDVQYDDSIVQCIFLIDTAAAITTLREDTIAALGFKNFVPQSCNVRILGHHVAIGVSKKADVLGQDFFIKSERKLVVDYKLKRVRLI